jgi:hypothetical protein
VGSGIEYVATLGKSKKAEKACKKAAKQSTKGVCQVLTGTATALFGGVELALGVAGTGPLDD